LKPSAHNILNKNKKRRMMRKMFQLDPDIGDITFLGDARVQGRLIYRHIKWVDPEKETEEEGECPPCVEIERDSAKIGERGMTLVKSKFLTLKETMECECGNHIIFYILFPHPDGDACFEVYEKWG
jgi:hypothetical protein